MLLAIDAGNTNVVFALVQGREVKARWRIATDPRRTADEYAVWLSQLLSLEGYAREQVGTVAISTVVPRALHNLQVLSRKYFKAEPLIAGKAPLDSIADQGAFGRVDLQAQGRAVPLERCAFED